MSKQSKMAVDCIHCDGTGGIRAGNKDKQLPWVCAHCDGDGKVLVPNTDENRRLWTPHGTPVDAFWNEILQLDDEASYNNYAYIRMEYMRYPREQNVGLRPRQMDEMNQYIRRRSTRCNDYYGPFDHQGRERRDGLDWTFVERKIIRWAFWSGTHVESKVEPTFDYIACLLQRTPAEVEAFTNENRPQQGPISGSSFFVK